MATPIMMLQEAIMQMEHPILVPIGYFVICYIQSIFATRMMETANLEADGVFQFFAFVMGPLTTVGLLLAVGYKINHFLVNWNRG